MFLNKQDMFQNGYKMVSLSGKIARYKIFVNVGGADMAFNCGDERIAFGPMAKGQKKYGATSSRLRRNEQVVVYNVQKDDTLAGIAIKFGVSTEQIRRVNHLWTNDSLFLRDKLLIPVPEESKDGDVDGGDGDSEDGNSSQEFKMQPHWSHPLCDSLEEDCIVSPESVKLGLGSTSTSSNLELDLNSSAASGSETWCSNSSHASHATCNSNSTMDSLSNTSYTSASAMSVSMSNGGYGHGHGHGVHSSQSHSPLPGHRQGQGQVSSNSKKLKNSHSNSKSMDNGNGNGHGSSSSYQNAYNTNTNTTGDTSTSDTDFRDFDGHQGQGQGSDRETPTSPSSTSSSRRSTIVDYSEKSAEEFLSRIDTAIASSKKQAKSQAEQDKAPWVTFDSDSESTDRERSSGTGTSITRQGRHLRYSLRKLEKAQEELFQL